MLAAGPASAQDQFDGKDRPLAAAIQFLSADASFGGEPVAKIGPLREGHTTLWWSPLPSATTYRLLTPAGASIYHGHLPQAFVSGLPDGEHHFVVEAIAPSGDVLARSAAPLVVQVQHWEPRTAWLLFAVGATVVGTLLIVLLVGMSRAGNIESEPAAADQAPVGHPFPSSSGDNPQGGGE